ncbi:MAG: hypothetical protein IJZ39_00010 [Oscillospiraceae bacterium]|nr:hypothetical protein [Oscillospiraceae bacterium]
MKKALTVTALLLVFALTLSACAVDLTAKAEPQVKEMLTALSAQDAEAAAALLHPDRADDATDAAIAALMALMDGREVASCVQVGLNVHTNTGTGGTARTESGTVHILFADGSDLRLEYSYVSDNSGEGFATFQFLVGI